ncbi:MAG: DUF3617 domain-containing protein [Henriciella sp.]|uniref:DUF3617 domain-containing protein n=1 Tax=Henriciella sp. TaxID=1968823 RepID=UPI0026371904|nr:DUF3617 domain-containing protein [Henriciella sp.]
MRLHALTTVAITATLIASTASAQSLGVKPGKWETSHTFTGTVKAQGMSMSLPGKTTTDTQCITEEDATFKPEDLSGEECTTSNVQSTGKSISFDIDCSQSGTSMTGRMETTASNDGTSMEGTMTMEGSQPGGGSIDMKGDFSGTRIGSCS